MRKVRLSPCGSAVVRLVNDQGKPLSKYRPNPYGMQVVIQPGFAAGSKDREKPADPDTVALEAMDPLHYRDGIAANAEGRITLPALIPGATYRIADGGQETQFTAAAGRTLELPNMMILYPGQ